MIKARIPEDEDRRLAAIAQYRLDFPGQEPAFNHAVQLAVDAFQVPISLVSIVGADMQCFKGRVGLDVDETGRDIAFCSHAILGTDVMVIEDAVMDPRFADNPMVVGDPGIRFYAGAPLRLRDGQIPGTLCLIDRCPREFSARDRAILERLASLVVDIIELRLESSMAAERHLAIDKMKDDFLAAASHELRTPITSIIGSLGLLSTFADTLPDPAQRLVGIAHNNSLRLARLVNDILDLSKLAENSISFDVERLDASQVIAECRDANSGFGTAHNVALVTRKVQEQLFFEADAHRVQQVLANLVSNAVKFSNMGGIVELSVSDLGNFVRLSVGDSGRGIPHEFRSRIFERFEQVELTDSSVKGGSGLGLAIAREMVVRMGGRIDFDSVLGQGTTFHVDLPKQASILVSR